MSILLLKLPGRFGNEGDPSLQKFFSTFPGEWPGLGLLLLRALVGLALIGQGVAYIQSPNRGVATWGLAALAFSSGGFLLAGLMTPLVAVVAAIGGIGIALAWIPSPGPDAFDSSLAIINRVVLSIAIALLGPGAFSLDALMFGKREITIPTKSHLSKS